MVAAMNRFIMGLFVPVAAPPASQTAIAPTAVVRVLRAKVN